MIASPSSSPRLASPRAPVADQRIFNGNGKSPRKGCGDSAHKGKGKGKGKGAGKAYYRKEMGDAVHKEDDCLVSSRSPSFALAESRDFTESMTALHALGTQHAHIPKKKKKQKPRKDPHAEDWSTYFLGTVSTYLISDDEDAARAPRRARLKAERLSFQWMFGDLYSIAYLDPLRWSDAQSGEVTRAEILSETCNFARPIYVQVVSCDSFLAEQKVTSLHELDTFILHHQPVKPRGKNGSNHAGSERTSEGLVVF